jgi:hypothetical protein
MCLPTHVIANVCDIYFANHTVESRSDLVLSDFRTRTSNASENVHKALNVNAGERLTGSANAQVNGPRGDSKGMKTGGSSLPVSKGGLCNLQVTNY